VTLPTAYDMVKNDYLYFDNVQTVTLTPLTGSAVATAKGQREPVSGLAWETLVLGSESTFAVFNLYDTTLGSLEPAPGFKVTDEDAADWIVKEAKPMTFGTRWRCLCVRAV